MSRLLGMVADQAKSCFLLPAYRIQNGRPVAAGLLAMAIIPVVAGVVRLVSLATGDTVTLANNARFFAHPLPVRLHMLGASLFLMLRALPFRPGLRRRFPDGHRYAGMFLAPDGMIAGLSGVWTNQFSLYAEIDGPLLFGFRLIFGASMILNMVLRVAAILQRGSGQHRAWMMRAYAIGLGEGTQAATQPPWILLVGQTHEQPRAPLMAWAWLLNLAVAEWFTRRAQVAQVGRATAHRQSLATGRLLASIRSG